MPNLSIFTLKTERNIMTGLCHPAHFISREIRIVNMTVLVFYILINTVPSIINYVLIFRKIIALRFINFCT